MAALEARSLVGRSDLKQPQRPRFSLGGQVSVMASSNSDLALAAAASSAVFAATGADPSSSMIASSAVNRARSTSSIYHAVADEFGAVKSLVRTNQFHEKSCT